MALPQARIVPTSLDRGGRPLPGHREIAKNRITLSGAFR
jgi:hypothetical protein